MRVLVIAFFLTFSVNIAQAQYSFRDQNAIWPGGFLYWGNQRVMYQPPYSDHSTVVGNTNVRVMTISTMCNLGRWEMEDVILIWHPTNDYLPGGWRRVLLPVCGAKITQVIVTSSSTMIVYVAEPFCTQYTQYIVNY